MTTELTTYVIHHGYGYDEENEPDDSIVQAAGYEFIGEYDRNGPAVVFKDAEAKTVAVFNSWKSFEREGGIVRREVARKDIKPEAPKHR
jgi:hypothetical protein